MAKGYFAYLLLGHILGDFYVQTKGMAEKKENHLIWVLIHGAAYLGAFLLAALPIASLEIIVVAVIASAAHFLIDLIKHLYLLKIKKSKMTQSFERNMFFGDQILHIISLITIGYIATRNNQSIAALKIIDDFLIVAGTTGETAASWILALLIIHKPVNIAIQKLLMVYRPKGKDESGVNDNNAGRFIGTVERLIMLMFISIGQYSAIGLVLTAKSIARYDKIAREPEFAEYYLLGTLLSTASVVIASSLL